MNRLPDYDYQDMRTNIRTRVNYLLAKTSTMFEWEGLPETIPPNELERLLQVYGYAFIANVNGELYAFTGGLGGEPDAYGNPTQIVISNPHLKFNETLDIATDGVLIKNDPYQVGLYPLLNQYSWLLNESTVNMVLNGFNTRMRNVFSADDDRTKKSVERYLERIREGELGVIGENAIFDGVKNHGSATSAQSNFADLIEYHQYIKAELHHELGLNLAFNMKRERLNESETELNNDALYPFLDSMAGERLAGVEALYQHFGEAVAVDFGGIWYKKRVELVDNVVGNNEPQALDSDEPIHLLDEPMDEPEEPLDEPEEQLDEPEEPLDEPLDEPEEPLDEPLDEPEEPLDEPEEPLDEPEDPLDEPEEPLDEPEEPLDDEEKEDE